MAHVARKRIKRRSYKVRAEDSTSNSSSASISDDDVASRASGGGEQIFQMTDLNDFTLVVFHSTVSAASNRHAALKESEVFPLVVENVAKHTHYAYKELAHTKRICDTIFDLYFDWLYSRQLKADSGAAYRGKLMPFMVEPLLTTLRRAPLSRDTLRTVSTIPVFSQFFKVRIRKRKTTIYRSARWWACRAAARCWTAR